MPTRLLAAVLLAAGTALPPAAPAQEPGPPLFEFDGRTWRPEDLSARMRQLYGAMLTEQHRELRDLVDEMVFDVYAEREAQRQARPVREVGAELLAVPEPDEAAVQQFYQSNRDRIPQSLEEVAPRIRQYLLREARLRKRSEVVARIKSEGGFALRLEEPRMPPLAIDTRGRPVKGDPSAPITVVEFADYQCPNCARAVPLMNQIIEQYPGKVKLVHMDFPINSSGISRRVAYGAACAQAQGRFWDYHDAAYARQGTLGEDSPLELATALGLDLERFTACMKDPSHRVGVQAAEREGRRLGVTATPTLFVDGRPFPTSHLLRDLGEYIEKRTKTGG